MKFALQTIICAVLFLSSIVISAQETETRELDNFSGISVSAGIQASLVKGSTNEIFISAKGVDLDRIETDIRKNTLRVKIDQNWWNKLTGHNKRKVEVTITYNNSLEKIVSKSGARVESEETILANELNLRTSSGANMYLDIEASDVEIDVSSGATMNLSGSADKADIDISSGSSLKAYKFEATHVSIDGSSGSSAKITATESLDVEVSSGASVKYKGEPTQRDFDKSSGGSVRKA